MLQFNYLAKDAEYVTTRLKNKIKVTQLEKVRFIIVNELKLTQY